MVPRHSTTVDTGIESYDTEPGLSLPATYASVPPGATDMNGPVKSPSYIRKLSLSPADILSVAPSATVIIGPVRAS